MIRFLYFVFFFYSIRFTVLKLVVTILQITLETVTIHRYESHIFSRVYLIRSSRQYVPSVYPLLHLFLAIEEGEYVSRLRFVAAGTAYREMGLHLVRQARFSCAYEVFPI